MKDGDAKIQSLKEEKHEKNLESHYVKKEIEINKLEEKRLKNNLKTVREDRLKSNERANELETNLEATKSCVDELQ